MIISLGMTVWAADEDGDGYDDETGDPVAAETTEGGTITITLPTEEVAPSAPVALIG